MAKINTFEFDTEKPLWHIFVKEDYEENTSVLFVLINHMLTDGMGIMGILTRISDKTSSEEIVHHRQIPFFHYYILPLFYVPKLLYKFFVVGSKTKADPKMYPFQLDTGKQSGEKIYLESKHYQLDDLRKCYNNFGNMKLNDFMLASMSAGLSTYFDKLGVKDQSYFTVVIPVNMKPSPRSIEDVKFSNMLTASAVNIPLSKNLNYVMKETKKSLNVAFTMPILRFGMYMMDFFGICPVAMIRMLKDKTILTLNVTISNTPGPSKPAYFYDCKIKDFAGIGQNNGTSGLTFLISSYCGEVKFQALADKNLKMDPKVLMKHIEEQLDNSILNFC